MNPTFSTFCCLLPVAVILCTSSVSSDQQWPALRATYGQYNAHPRTEFDAVAEGWELVGPTECNASASYNGIAYVKDQDYGIVLLYDINGYIAGMQVQIDREQAESEGYPSEHIQPPFVLDGLNNSRYILTVYFIEPSKICTEGRTQEEFEKEGTGNGLFFQTGNTPNDVTVVPHDVENVTEPWVPGRCFPTMGLHFWVGLNDTTNCDKVWPYFLLYNQGKLNGFGWAMFTHTNSSVLEKVREGANLRPFIIDIPGCFAEVPKKTTLHVYFNDEPAKITC